MKITLSVLAIIIVIVLGFVLFGGKDKKIAVTDNTQGGEPLPEGTYVVDTERTIGTWEGKKTLIDGYRDIGTIMVKDGTILVSNGAIAGGTLTVDMTSIKATSTGVGAGEDNLTKHLKSADFFDIEKFPTSTFTLSTSTSVSNQNIDGMLTLKGISNPVIFPASIYIENGALRIRGTAVLDRTKWGVVYGSGSFFDNLKNNVIDDKFSIAFDLIAELQK